MSGRSWVLGALALGVALACNQTAPEAPSPEDEEEAPPTETMNVPANESSGPRQVAKVGERELAIRLEAERPRFMVSEPVFVEVVFEADADSGLEVELSWMGRNRLGRPENYRVQLIDPDGEPIATPDAGPGMGGQSWVAKVGEKPARQRLFLPNWFTSLAPGRHVVSVQTLVPARASADAAWDEVAVALTLEVEVVADDPAALGELIEALASTARGEDGDAARRAMQQLAAIDDPRTLEPWIALAEYPGYERRFAAIRALAETADPRALAALIRASQTEASELPADRYTTEALREQSAGQLRLAAAQVLAERPEPEALEAVLKLEKDPEYSVRLTVAQRAAKLDGALRVVILSRLAADPNATVSGEAKRLLGD